MEKLTLKQIQIYFPEVAQLELIAKGAFTYVFTHSDSTKVLVVSNCSFKECNSMGWLPESDSEYYYYPTITKLDYNEGYNLFVMPKYIKVGRPKQQLNSQAYEIYKELREHFAALTAGHKLWDQFKIFENLIFSSDNLKEFVQESLNASGNYTDSTGWEISPRNIATDDQGNLVLLDVMFNRAILKHMYKKAG